MSYPLSVHHVIKDPGSRHRSDPGQTPQLPVRIVARLTPLQGGTLDFAVTGHPHARGDFHLATREVPQPWIPRGFENVEQPGRPVYYGQVSAHDATSTAPWQP